MKRTFLSLSLLALLVSCVNDDVLTQSDFISNITITAEDIRLAEPELATRTDLSVTSSGLQFAWAAEDVVGIYPNVGDQVSFPMTKGAGTQSANFDGGGWAVKSGSTYAAYFPYSVDNTTYGRSYTALPLSYTGQRQTANSSTAHLGDYDYMVATASSPSNGTIGFKFTHINSFLYIQLTTPDAATFTKLTLSADEPIFTEEATVDISTGIITPTKTSQSITLALDNISLAANEMLYAWLAVAPADMTGKTFTATLTTKGGTPYKTAIAGKKFETGRAYILSENVFPVYTYVDLGLSVKWATFNVGADSPEDIGGSYAWGETETKDTYNWSNYKWCSGSSTTLTKYCSSSSYGVVDYKTILDPADDVAHVKWGNNWRMPTSNEFVELVNSCELRRTSKNGKNCYQVIGINGNSIFIPYGQYHTSSCDRRTSEALGAVFLQGGASPGGSCSRYSGFLVRPVYAEAEVVESIALNQSSINLEVGDITQLTATICPSSATDKTIFWESSNSAVANIGYNGVVTAKSVGAATIKATASNGMNVKCEIVVSPKTSRNEHEYVDLGLYSGLKWATCNIGAETPEDFGEYYAWGETEPKSTYDWSTYKWYSVLYDGVTKYCKDLRFGTVLDNKNELDLVDDVAHVQWGGGWRMPSSNEFYDLRSQCTWTRTQQNNVDGYKVTGKNGNYIFLPASSYWSREGCYSNSEETYHARYATCVYASGREDVERCKGYPVRPVCTE